MSWIDYLPHQPPMRLLDEVVEVVPGERAVGRRTTQPSDFFFQGHFPGEPIVPAVILVELLAQVGGLAAAAPVTGEPAPSRRLRVAAIGQFKFTAPATCGVVLEARARIVGQLGRLVKIEGEVTADGVVVAAGGLTLAG